MKKLDRGNDFILCFVKFLLHFFLFMQAVTNSLLSIGIDRGANTGQSSMRRDEVTQFLLEARKPSGDFTGFKEPFYIRYKIASFVMNQKLWCEALVS